MKSQCNDFPEFYAEYCINDLGNTGEYNYAGEWWRKAKMPDHLSKSKYFQLESLEKDLIENGMTHPIIIWAFKRECRTLPNPTLPQDLLKRRDILYVQIGHQRVWVAQKLKHTHISAYHVTTQEDFDRVRSHTESDDYWKKYLHNPPRQQKTGSFYDGHNMENKDRGLTTLSGCAPVDVAPC